MQLLSDRHGTHLHLFERIVLKTKTSEGNRRGPTPHMTDEVRAAMTRAAVNAAKATTMKGQAQLNLSLMAAAPLPSGVLVYGNEYPFAG